MSHVIIHTDGACRGNPGPGGWGAILQTGGGHEKELCGGEALTTNNRMELMAAIMGLEALKRPCRVRLVTDSRYVKDGLEKWLPGWKRSSWRTAGNEPVKNQELWQRLDAAAGRHQLALAWTRGHAGHPENSRCDELAQAAAAAARLQAPASTVIDRA